MLVPGGCFWFDRSNPQDVAVRLSSRVGAYDSIPEIALDTRLLEQPFDDDFLNRRLWNELTDPLPHQLSALLANNGIRVGVLSGIPSAEFTRLATAEATVIAPTIRRGSPGRAKTVPVNGPIDRCRIRVLDALVEDARTLDVKSVECAMAVTTTPQASGKLTLRFEFQLQHGNTRAWWTPTADGGFDRSEGRTPEAFPTLTFEQELAPSDTLVIGPTTDTTETLGATYFHTTDASRRRVLVVRATADDGSLPR